MRYLFLLLALPFIGCTEPKVQAQDLTTGLTIETEAPPYSGASLPPVLKEISGLTRDGAHVWAISDAPVPVLYKLNQQGNIIQQNELRGIKVTDMESLTSDERYVYIADIGNNKGKRASRNIIKVAKSALKNNGTVNGEVITFNFSDNPTLNSEAILAHGSALYIFTKQQDGRTQLYMLPKDAKQGEAHRIAELNAGGMITDASINHSGNEVALVGYGKGHSAPFVILLSNFSGNNFFSGKASRHQLPQAGHNWQVESISYLDDETLSFACEETKDVPQTLYTITRTALLALPQQHVQGQYGSPDRKDEKKKKKD